MSRIGFFAFLAIVIGVWVSLHLYVHANLSAVGAPRLPLTLALWALALSLPVSRAISMKLSGPAPRALNWVASVWMGLVFMLASWLLIASLARRALAAAGFPEWVEPRPWILWTSLAVLLFGALGAAKALGAPRVVRYRVDRRARYGLGRNLRLVQVSDIHMSLILGSDWLERLVDRINSLEPDLVCITGDFLDPEFPDDAGAARALRRLKAREGVFAVSGNHDFYSGIQRFLALMRGAGVTVLENECHTTVSGLQVAGWHDQTAGRGGMGGASCDPDRALSGIDPARPSVVLAHQPKELEGAALRRADLVLCGHTHAGQIFPFRAAVRIVFRYVAGRHRLGPDTDLVVCTGTGFWGPPLRVGSDSQIVVVDFAA